MKKEEVLEFIKKAKLVPVIRTNSAKDAENVINILSDCGIEVFEITLSVPNAVKLMETAAKNSEILIGAGTVLNRKQAEECVNSGAKFIVSPVTDAQTINFCQSKNIAVMPGALTPTEILNAYTAGADCVKIFPADAQGGAKYIKSLKAVFPHIPMMPTGGVSTETVADFFKAGAFAAGVGTDLTGVQILSKGEAAVKQRAAEYLNAANSD